MKNLLWASVFAATATMIVGCHEGEPAMTPGTVETLQARVVESRSNRCLKRCDPRGQFMPGRPR